MRTRFTTSAKIAETMISAIDQKIAECKDKINEYNDLISQLQVEKRRYSHLQEERVQTVTSSIMQSRRALLFEKPVVRSKKERIIMAIERMPETFDSEQLLNEINRDGDGEITKENFAPDFSRLKGEVYKKVGEKDGRGLYEKIVKK